MLHLVTWEGTILLPTVLWRKASINLWPDKSSVELVYLHICMLMFFPLDFLLKFTPAYFIIASKEDYICPSLNLEYYFSLIFNWTTSLWLFFFLRTVRLLHKNWNGSLQTSFAFMPPFPSHKFPLWLDTRFILLVKCGEFHWTAVESLKYFGIWGIFFLDKNWKHTLHYPILKK